MALHFALMYLGLPFYFATITAQAILQVTNVTECSCGFYDHLTQSLFTESTIVYFNETPEIPAGSFVVQQYEDARERGWNTLYRQGADASNAIVGQDSSRGDSNTSLKLFVDPATPAHLVAGGGVRTVRQDLFYGSFRMLLRSPTISGSSLSMDLTWNDTQSITTNLQSTDWPWTAWVSTLNGDEFPDRQYGVNYSVLANNGISPWDYTEFRVDWSPQEVNWTIGGKSFRSIQKSSVNEFPQTPVPLVLQHFSDGNWFAMQGPPTNRSVADVGWVRLFFNSSLTTSQEHANFDLRCKLSDACNMDDTSLRGATPYTSAATLKWKQIQNPPGDKEIPTLILIICGSISFLLISNALSRRLPWHKLRKSQSATFPSSETISQSPFVPSLNMVPERVDFAYTAQNSRPESYCECQRPASIVAPTPLLSRRSSIEVISVYLNAASQDEDRKSARISWREHSAGYHEPLPQFSDSQLQLPTNPVIGDQIFPIEQNGRFTNSTSTSTIMNARSPPNALGANSFSPAPKIFVKGDAQPSVSIQRASSESTDNLKNLTRTENKAISPAIASVTAPTNILSKKQRIDHLAGLVAFSCLVVTAIHFCLTFTPAAINPLVFAHYKSEIWARKTVGPYLLNLIWIGPFLMISTRFLISAYLKDGDLEDLARKAVGRPFRLIIPVAAIAMLEYFFMDSGATSLLEYLPSITWSSWPFTTVPHTFGNFLSEILELAYLIPNAAPQITFNFCTGALFTIPIQLQGAWVTFLAVIVIREIKKPWKRFGFYAFCVLMHWYALSWGSYFYLAILLVDLDITYKYRKWLKSHSLVYYPLVALCAIMAFGALSIDMTTQWTGVNYVGYEYGWHPDIPTGKPIMNTGAAGYPQYYVPKGHGLVFAFGLQALVEISPLAQRFFSLKPLILIFPHIFTIYLVHGFVFWSMGSAICVSLAGREIPYWANILIVAACCYTTLFLSLPLLTPIVETLGKNITKNIWQSAHETPAPRRSTLYPFPDDFLYVRQTGQQQADPDEKRPKKGGLSGKGQDLFQRFIASIIATISLSRQSDSNATCSASRSGSLAGRTSEPRTVGWRMGRLSGNVEVLRRNNSSAKNNRPTTVNN